MKMCWKKRNNLNSILQSKKKNYSRIRIERDNVQNYAKSKYMDCGFSMRQINELQIYMSIVCIDRAQMQHCHPYEMIVYFADKHRNLIDSWCMCVFEHKNSFIWGYIESITLCISKTNSVHRHFKYIYDYCFEYSNGLSFNEL